MKKDREEYKPTYHVVGSMDKEDVGEALEEVADILKAILQSQVVAACNNEELYEYLMTSIDKVEETLVIYREE